MYKAFCALGLSLMLALPAWASDHRELDALMQAKRLPFTGETPLILIDKLQRQSQSLAIVYSCAPYPEGCDAPVLKARSIQHRGADRYIWEFSDLDRCRGAAEIVQRLLNIHKDKPRPISITYRSRLNLETIEQQAEVLLAQVNPCLTTSYMTPPWERGSPPRE